MRCPTRLPALLLLLLLPAASCSEETVGGGEPAAVWTVRVLASYPHDPAAFTQGLVIAQGQLYESTGLHGQSTLRRVEVATGAVLDGVSLDDADFGEGLAYLPDGDRLAQLTWTSNRGLVYARDTLEQVAEFSYAGEGWGLAFDPTRQRLIMSDGTATLRFLDPASFAELGRVEVREGGRRVGMLNELEVVAGTLYANVLPTSRIARIDPETGRLEAWIDCSALRPAGLPPAAALNGIAYDPAGERFLLTGKLWPTLYAVEFLPPSSAR
ncbi:glutaminyl-peptide cyclotransferase [bacterium]|nr:glutaminyl-peptide cyclotransferase [bacterium]